MTTSRPSTHSTSGGGRFVPPTVEELDTILSNYEFVEIVGQGGMGAVYKARQPNLDRLVAIKVLPPMLDDPEMHFAERFKREARAMAKLNHSNIVSVYDFGSTSDNQLFFVMEFVEGTDLQHHVKAGQVSTEDALKWFCQVCDALQFAHSSGIIHRDVKPSNIMINQRGNVKVADFGLAKLTGDSSLTKLTMTNVAMGSPDYVAPESLHDDIELDARADLYAVGVMLYETLTGSVPRGAWQPPSLLRDDVDPRFDDLVIEAMDPNRDTRFQSADEIAARLQEIMDSPAVGRRKVTLLTGPVSLKATGPVPVRKAAPGSGAHRKAAAPGSGAHRKAAAPGSGAHRKAAAPGSGAHRKTAAPGSGGHRKVRLMTGPIKPGTNLDHTAPIPPPVLSDDPTEPITADEVSPAASKSGPSPLLIGIIVVILLILGAVAFIMKGWGDDSGTEPAANTGSAAEPEVTSGPSAAVLPVQRFSGSFSFPA